MLIATANSCQRLITPLLSRFVIVQVLKYTFEEFKAVSVGVLTKEKVDKRLAAIITQKVWSELNSKDIRDVVKIGRLSDNEEGVSFAIKMIKKYHLRE